MGEYYNYYYYNKVAAGGWYMCRYVQLLRTAAVSQWRHDRGIHRDGRGGVSGRALSLLSAAARARPAAGAGPSTATSISSTLYALSPSSVQVRYPALCPARPRRPAAAVTSPQGVHQAERLWRRSACM